MTKIEIPYKFKPRSYQLPLLRAMDSGFKRAITVWHRRAGKDKTLFNFLIKKSFERVGIYYYFFPEFAQGRRVIWDGMDNDGFRFLDHIPKQLIKSKNKVDMKIELVNGSIIQIIGTDTYDKIRGSNPIGCVFSEFAYQNPAAWDVVRPILMANGGWAIFNSTPFGKNHFYDMFLMGSKNKDWWTEVITVDDSLKEDGSHYLTEKDIQAERDAGMSDELIRQEYYCDFNSNSQGFYYLRDMNELRDTGKIRSVPHDPTQPVDTWWDIGFADPTCIWFTQSIGSEFRIIDYYQNNLVGLEDYVLEVSRKPYIYRKHCFPHDIAVTEWGTGRSRIEVAEELLGRDRITYVEKLPVGDGINAVRMVLPMCVFDEEKCADGINALQNYHREWDPKKREFRNEPLHDWSSHPADAFRVFALGASLQRKPRTMKTKPFRASSIPNSKRWLIA